MYKIRIYLFICLFYTYSKYFTVYFPQEVYAINLSNMTVVQISTTYIYLFFIDENFWTVSVCWQWGGSFEHTVQIPGIMVDECRKITLWLSEVLGSLNGDQIRIWVVSDPTVYPAVWKVHTITVSWCHYAVPLSLICLASTEWNWFCSCISHSRVWWYEALCFSTVNFDLMKWQGSLYVTVLFSYLAFWAKIFSFSQSG